MIASIAIFLVVYFFIASEKIEKSLAALLGAVAVIGCGLISFEKAIECVDMNVIFLLIGMMSCVGVLAETGFFEWVAIYIAKSMKGNALMILIAMLVTTMLFSALLDNVTTIILLAPVTILITQLLEVPSVPFLILEAIASNIGGTATLIGDPPNIIIGSQAELSFNDFLIHLAPGVGIIAVVFLIIIYFMYSKRLNVPENVKERVNRSYPKLAIRDAKKMKRSLLIFGLIFLGFFLHHTVHVPPGIVAVAGMCIMFIVCRSDLEDTLKLVEWDVIMFFVGLFIVIGALEANGVIEKLAEGMMKLCGDNILMAAMVVLAGSALFSAVLDNIPFVIVMMPLVKKLILDTGGTIDAHHPLLWALALGACLGGNGTLIGASANVVASKIGGRNGCPVSFGSFLKYGFPFTVITVILGMLYIWIRYFVLN